jgi:hypothetical protein
MDRRAAFFDYAENYLIDVKFGIIMDVKATRTIRQAEVSAAKTMIERTQERFGSNPPISWPIRLITLPSRGLKGKPLRKSGDCPRSHSEGRLVIATPWR